MSETPALSAASAGAEPILPAQPATELPETPPQRAVRRLKKRAAAKKAKKSAIDSNAETPKRRRKRGGQPGNTNAVSHGFYARRLPETELDGLDQTGVSSLKDEIDVMRVFSRKVAELGAEVDDLDEAKSLLIPFPLPPALLTALSAPIPASPIPPPTLPTSCARPSSNSKKNGRNSKPLVISSATSLQPNHPLSDFLIPDRTSRFVLIRFSKTNPITVITRSAL
jgi:hypothetical protein